MLTRKVSERGAPFGFSFRQVGAFFDGDIAQTFSRHVLDTYATTQPLDPAMSHYDPSKMLSNTAKYMINDALASVEGRRLVIEAEYCQGVCFALQRNVDPSLYHVMGNKQETYNRAIQLGAHAYRGWTRDILPTFEDNFFNMVYMDYCCSPTGNMNCRPIEEMDDVYRILKPGGKAMFTFCKRTSTRGQNNMKVAKKYLSTAGFSWVDTIEYRVDGNQPMFVVLCTKSWFEPFRAKHDQFNNGPNMTVSIPDKSFEHCPHMCMCDMCGSLYPDGVRCKRVKDQLYCEECIQRAEPKNGYNLRKRKRIRLSI